MFSTGQLMGGTFDKVRGQRSLIQYTACGRKDGSSNASHCTLLGPEGPDASTFGSELTSLRTFSDAGDAGSGEGTARTLRTTQWTRASF
jgi:hypothetical protein